jgi:hypothetical protein
MEVGVPRTPDYVSISTNGPEHIVAYSQKRVSWGAVFAGVVLALALQAGFGMLGAGIGLSIVNPAQGDTPGAQSFGLAAGIWWIVSSLIAVFFGGWAAGHLSSPTRRGDGALHGILAWAMSTIVMLYLLTSTLGSILGGMFGVMGQVSSAAFQAADGMEAPMLPGGSAANDGAGLLQDIRREASEIFARATNTIDPGDEQAANPDVSSLLSQVLAQDDRSPAARQTLVDTLATQGGITRDEAERTVANWEARYAQIAARVEERGRQAAERSAEGAARAAWVGFIAMLLGIGTAALGGALAERGARRAAVVYP